MSRLGLDLKALKDMPGAAERARNLSGERLTIVALSVALGTMTLLWQSERLKPAPSFVVTQEGSIAAARPTDPNLRTPEEIKVFAERTWRGLYGWNYDLSPSLCECKKMYWQRFKPSARKRTSKERTLLRATPEAARSTKGGNKKCK
ncbi:hypothetical protein [Gloeobacter morelensis]|uniref:Uncharacterized protein n=1 Tax=Gloeobacter morelensis MG652769 TaxID=2781736 RepID=A0ABY3PG58_9CYAN|nr:hypothetical protein [Gloeobacter morelensis]UFP92619.1 hypothetical protein ISF26_12260 [Gloeobacter morelensis MG652769]